MATTEPQLDAAEEPEVAVVASNEYVANSFGEYVHGQWQRIRSGDAGVLPVVVGLIVIAIVFQIENSKFLSAGNLVSLFQQASLFIVFGLAEIFILLLGEIDLSIGFNAGVGATVIAELAAPPNNYDWFVATLIGVAVCSVIGLVQGVLVTRFNMPSFIVTLGGYLGLQGLILYLFDADKHSVGGSISIFNGVINGIIYNQLSVSAGWIVMVVLVALYAVVATAGNLSRRRRGLSAPPLAVTGAKVALAAVGGVVVVLICNQNRGLGLKTLQGVPYVVLVVVAAVAIYTFILDRTRFGRYVYAIGGNAEAARRAGIRVRTIRTVCFVLAGFTAGIAGLLADSFQGGASSAFDGGRYVLYAVAAAVIGGTSLFGGRGRMMHALLGGLVIAGIANGMYLLDLSTAAQEMVNAIVLLAAVLVDSVARRGRQT